MAVCLSGLHPDAEENPGSDGARYTTSKDATDSVQTPREHERPRGCRAGRLNRWAKVAVVAFWPATDEARGGRACGLLLVLRRLSRPRPGRRVAGVLGGAGRLSLTHYLTQSLVMALVFTGYGLAWYGRHGTAVLLAGCLVLYAVQLAAGGWLLGRVRYGPAEWLLRAVTLARRP